MVHPIQVQTAQPDYDDGVVVTFSDGTTAAYVVEELLRLRPHRESIKENQFRHRQYSDGSCDSVCIVCFMTVGSGRTKAQIGVTEKAHRCDDSVLARLRGEHEVSRISTRKTQAGTNKTAICAVS
jgi:hypothetical protein